MDFVSALNLYRWNDFECDVRDKFVCSRACPTPPPTPDPTTISPTSSPITSDPTTNPTLNPTLVPSFSPTISPTFNPSESPTIFFSKSPTTSPINVEEIEEGLKTNNDSISPALIITLCFFSITGVVLIALAFQERKLRELKKTKRVVQNEIAGKNGMQTIVF